jgi:hypothetical protein
MQNFGAVMAEWQGLESRLEPEALRQNSIGLNATGPRSQSYRRCGPILC